MKNVIIFYLLSALLHIANVILTVLDKFSRLKGQSIASVGKHQLLTFSFSE